MDLSYQDYLRSELKMVWILFTRKSMLVPIATETNLRIREMIFPAMNFDENDAVAQFLKFYWLLTWMTIWLNLALL